MTIDIIKITATVKTIENYHYRFILLLLFSELSFFGKKTDTRLVKYDINLLLRFSL